MQWLTEDALVFFSDLEQNNNREWFEANKKRYEAVVKQPLEVLAAALIPLMQELDPEIDVEPKKALFRIYRDTRFSKDKTPYKTNAGLSLSARKNDFARPGLYFHVDANCIASATGCYQLEPDQIGAMRRHIASHLDEFKSIQSDKAFLSKFDQIRGEKGKKIPPELAEAAAQEPLIYNRSFYVWAEYKPDEIPLDDLPEFVMSHMRAAWPLNLFLMRGLAG
jgi:uncharacterized protein (TIGR02453 family)